MSRTPALPLTRRFPPGRSSFQMHTRRTVILRILAALSVAGIGGCFWGVPSSGSWQTLGAAAPGKSGETTPATPIPFPNGVTDPDLRTAFVSSPKGGIQAIRLEDGKVLWANDA